MPSGSLEPALEKATDNGIVPLVGEPPATATGGWFDGGAAESTSTICATDGTPAESTMKSM